MLCHVMKQPDAAPRLPTASPGLSSSASPVFSQALSALSSSHRKQIKVLCSASSLPGQPERSSDLSQALSFRSATKKSDRATSLVQPRQPSNQALKPSESLNSNRMTHESNQRQLYHLDQH